MSSAESEPAELYIVGEQPTDNDNDQSPLMDLLHEVASGGSSMTSWVDKAYCAGVDPELFFPSAGMSQKIPKAFCDACEVRVECLDFAMQHNIEHGIWGGKSRNERNILRRHRNLAQSA